MKQFKLFRANGSVRGPLSGSTARNLQARLEDVDTVDGMQVGMSWVDPDGDTWVRLPDIKTADGKQRDERLERIATAAMIGVMTSPNQPLGLREDKIATLAVTVGKALIAELDKQA